ncbi:MAG: cell division protein FtsZ, partial [Xanthobacteraceae bacterium]
VRETAAPPDGSPPRRAAGKVDFGRCAPRGSARGLDPYGRSSPVRNLIEENLLDIPAFLRRKAN